MIENFEEFSNFYYLNMAKKIKNSFLDSIQIETRRKPVLPLALRVYNYSITRHSLFTQTHTHTHKTSSFNTLKKVLNNKGNFFFPVFKIDSTILTKSKLSE